MAEPGAVLRFLAGCMLACGALASDAAGSTFFVSDLHLGVGRDVTGKWSRLEDFRWHNAFAAFLDHLSATTHDDAELVILGDMLELWQSSRMTCTTVLGIVSCEVQDCIGRDTGCSEREALDRLKHVVKQHRDTLRALGAFARRGKNRVVIVPGNHDAALLFPAAAALLKQEVGAPPDRVTVAMTGRWQSADGKVLAEHGHQFDKVNAFDGWPRPFVTKDRKQVMQRPGGELLVQTFYNRYEQQFEAIDNFATETEGLSYAIRDLGSKGVVVAIHEFAYFLLVRSSLEQRFDWLGSTRQEGRVEWDAGRIRKDNSAAFVLDSLPADAPERQVLAEAHRKGELSALVGQLTNEDIQTLCDRIEFLAQLRRAGSEAIERCPKVVETDANLGYFAGRLLSRDDSDMIAYLAKTQTELRKPLGAFTLFVYGHTHSARQPRPIKITPEWEVSVVNTGAFQRIASPEFIAGIPESERSDPAFLSKLTLDRLPDCYSFVALKSVGNNTVAQLRYWRGDAKAKKWTEGEDCNRP